MHKHTHACTRIVEEESLNDQMLYMAALPPPFPKALPSILAGDRQWEWATWKVKWEIKNLREVRDVTTTEEAGEKKNTFSGSAMLVHLACQKPILGEMVAYRQMQGDWEWDDWNESGDEEVVGEGEGEGVKKEDAAEHLLECSGDSKWPSSLMVNCFIQRHFCDQRKVKPL